MRLRDSRSTRQFVYTRIDLIKTKWNYLRIKRRREATTTTTTAANRSRFRYNVCERNEIISLNFAHSHTNIECWLSIHSFWRVVAKHLRDQIETGAEQKCQLNALSIAILLFCTLFCVCARTILQLKTATSATVAAQNASAWMNTERQQTSK